MNEPTKVNIESIRVKSKVYESKCYINIFVATKFNELQVTWSKTLALKTLRVSLTNVCLDVNIV